MPVPVAQLVERWTPCGENTRLGYESPRLGPRTFLNGTRVLTTLSPTLYRLSYRERHFALLRASERSERASSY